MDILGPNIFEIVKDYANIRTDYEYFIKYKDYTNAIILKLKERDYREVINLVNKRYDVKDINWGKILGTILDTDFRDFDTILKILKKTENYNYFAASLIKHDMLDCFRAVFKKVRSDTKDLQTYARSLGYIFDSKNYDYFYDEVFEKLQKDLKKDLKKDEDEEEDEEGDENEDMDLDLYADLDELKTGLMEGLSEVKFSERKSELSRSEEFQHMIFHNSEFSSEKSEFGILEYRLYINGGMPMITGSHDRKEIERNCVLARAGYFEDLKTILGMIPAEDKKSFQVPLVQPRSNGPAIIDPNVFMKKQSEKLRDNTILYILMGAIIGNRYDVCERLLDMLENVDPDMLFNFIVDNQILTCNIFYEQRMRLPILFLGFILEIFKDENTVDIIVDDLIVYTENYENMGFLKYMQENGFEFKDTLGKL